MIKTTGLYPNMDGYDVKSSHGFNSFFLLHSVGSCGDIHEQYDEQNNHGYSGQHHSSHLLPSFLHGLFTLPLVL